MDGWGKPCRGTQEESCMEEVVEDGFSVIYILTNDLPNVIEDVNKIMWISIRQDFDSA